MTPEDRILKEIDTIAKRAMKKRRYSEITPNISAKKKIKFRSVILRNAR